MSCRPRSTSSIRRSGAPRSRRSTSCAPCCCRCLYTVRSERLLMEQLDYNLLFRWFVGLNMDEPVWDPSTFTQEPAAVAGRRYRAGLLRPRPGPARERDLLSDEHFTVDATLLEAWAGLKSFRPKDDDPTDQPPPDDPGNPTVDFHGQRRSNATHHVDDGSRDARLAPQGPRPRGEAVATWATW